MAEWAYRATRTKVGFEETRDLAVVEGFLCRAAYEQNGSRTDNTQHVHFGDVIHVYFVDQHGARTIGTFEIVGPNRHRRSALFGRSVPDTDLLRVADATFAERLGSLAGGTEGYQVDPTLGVFTGWALIPRQDFRTPRYPATAFSGQLSLVRLE